MTHTCKNCDESTETRGGCECHNLFGLLTVTDGVQHSVAGCNIKVSKN